MKNKDPKNDHDKIRHRRGQNDPSSDQWSDNDQRESQSGMQKNDRALDSEVRSAGSYEGGAFGREGSYYGEGGHRNQDGRLGEGGMPSSDKWSYGSSDHENHGQSYGGGQDGHRSYQGGNLEQSSGRGNEGQPQSIRGRFDHTREPGMDGNHRSRSLYGESEYGRNKSGSRSSDSGSGMSDRDNRSETNFRGKGPRGYSRSDERIKEEISEQFLDDQYLDASDIDIEISEGEVTLSGEVTDRKAKRYAEDLAEECSGVKHVQNNIRLRSSGNDQQKNSQNSIKNDSSEESMRLSDSSKGAI